MIENKRRFCRIAVTLPIRETFTYAVPGSLVPVARVGCRALVPFRNRKIIGYILGEEEAGNGEGEEVKDILDILDPEPLFGKNLVPFFEWMAGYYLHPVGRLIQSALPPGLNVTPFKTGVLTEKGNSALESPASSPEDRKLLSWIKDHPGRRLPAPLYRACRLQEKGWIHIESGRTRRPVGPMKRKFVRVREGADMQRVLDREDASFKLKNEREFIRALSESGKLSLKEIRSRFTNGPRLIEKWKSAGVIEELYATVVRDPTGKILVPSPEPASLFDQQEKALKMIRGRLDRERFSTCLLHGVTGSGKTEVYYGAVRHALRLGRRAILMVPEIALAVYIEGLFRSRLGDRVGLYHSALSRGERYDQWLRMLRGEVDLVIGARSALFAPLPGLGLIIVDEEYDFSYKQDGAPRYQGRDAAVLRGKMENALVVLGAGTPSIQSFQNSVSGRYDLLSMPDRIEKRPPPDIEIIDMKEISKGNNRDEILSPGLKQAVEQNLDRGKQAILFLNRRGYGRLYLCRSCGEAVRCRNCDLTLTYHLERNLLACHYCGLHMEPGAGCPSCGYKGGMKAYGFGTEKMERELSRIFPGARIARMDRDSTRRKGQPFHIIKQFSENAIDILVGTQMITKGYDFPNVTLVGVIAADLSLNFPDFRAGERTFQILSQVAGRAGRGDWKGRVIIQTFNPGHYAIRTAKDHDYDTFFQKEKELRELLEYPPFTYLAFLRFQGNNMAGTEEMARKVGEGIRRILKRWPKKGKEIRVLGPAECPLPRLKGKYRRQILIKCKKTGLLHYLLNEVEDFSRSLLRNSGVGMIIDVDPYQML